MRVRGQVDDVLFVHVDLARFGDEEALVDGRCVDDAALLQQTAEQRLQNDCVRTSRRHDPAAKVFNAKQSV